MEFGTIKSAQGFDKPLSSDDLIRAVYQLISAELEAISMYRQIIEATDDERAIAIISSVIEEEKVHSGEFLKLLLVLDPAYREKLEEGMKEAQDLIVKEI